MRVGDRSPSASPWRRGLAIGLLGAAGAVAAIQAPTCFRLADDDAALPPAEAPVPEPSVPALDSGAPAPMGGGSLTGAGARAPSAGTWAAAAGRTDGDAPASAEAQPLPPSPPSSPLLRVRVATESGASISEVTAVAYAADETQVPLERLADEPGVPGAPALLRWRPASGARPQWIELRAAGRVSPRTFASASATTLVRLALASGIAGMVREEGTERPLECIRVDLVGPGVVRTQSGPAGRFHAQVPWSGSTRVVAEGRWTDPTTEVALGERVEATPTVEAEVVLHVPRRVALSGRVLVDGIPVDGVRVRGASAPSEFHGTTPTWGTSTTDAGGAYDFPEVGPDGLWLELDFGSVRGGVVERWVSTTPGEDGRARADVALPAPWTIVGRVVRGGAGVPGAAVSAFRRVPGVERGSCATVSGADGGFTLRGWCYPSATLVLIVEGPDGDRVRRQAPFAEGACELRGLLLELPPVTWVRGRVRDAEGRPLAGASIEAQRQDREALVVLTGQDGAYRVAQPAGYRSLVVGAPGHVTVSDGFEVPPAGCVHDVVLARGGWLTGRVVDAHGQPVAGAAVMYSTDDPATKRDWTLAGADGVFFTPVVAGTRFTLQVTAHAKGLVPRTLRDVPVDTIVPDIVLETPSPK